MDGGTSVQSTQLGALAPAQPFLGGVVQSGVLVELTSCQVEHIAPDSISEHLNGEEVTETRIGRVLHHLGTLYCGMSWYKICLV